jgi:hypothetical protein
MAVPHSDYKEFKEKSSSHIILLAIEFRPDEYVYAIIPLRHGFIRYTRLCKSSRIADILRDSNFFLQYGDMELN